MPIKMPITTVKKLFRPLRNFFWPKNAPGIDCTPNYDVNLETTLRYWPL